MAITVVLLAEAVRDAYTAETITDARMLRAIEASLRYYSRFNPILVTATLTTVASQSNYSLPEGCIQVLDVEYWPLGSPINTSNVDMPLWIDKPGRQDMADIVIRNMDRSMRIDAYGGFFEIVDDGDVQLSPTPTSVISVPYRYYKAHELNEAETSATTIPASDLEMLRDLVVAEVLQTWANNLVTEPDYVRGLGKVTKKHLPVSISQRVSKLRQAVQQRYGGSLCEIG